MITVYRIISYILLLIACFFVLGIVGGLLVAFSNPALLFTVFIATAVVLYSFSSYQFLRKGIDRQQLLKKTTKDFIKVNAYVALFFALMNIFQSLTIIMQPSVLKDAIGQISAIQKQDMGMTEERFFSLMKQLVWALLFYGVALVAHIMISFKLIKIHADLFSIGKEDTFS
jgi:hypothetical protein